MFFGKFFKSGGSGKKHKAAPLNSTKTAKVAAQPNVQPPTPRPRRRTAEDYLGLYVYSRLLRDWVTIAGRRPPDVTFPTIVGDDFRGTFGIKRCPCLGCRRDERK